VIDSNAFQQGNKELDEEALVILATADDALSPVPHARLRRVRGQLTYIPAGAIEPPHAVVLRGGMVLPPVDGICVVGASYDWTMRTRRRALRATPATSSAWNGSFR